MDEITEDYAKEILKFVEDSEGNARLDNMVREPRYQYAKGFLQGLSQERKNKEADNSKILALQGENMALIEFLKEEKALSELRHMCRRWLYLLSRL